MLKALKLFWKESWLLIAASFFFGLLLAVTYTAWNPKIEQNKTAKFEKQVSDVVSGAKLDAPIDGDFVISDKISTKVYPVKSQTGEKLGFAFAAQGPGYDIIELVIVVDANCENYLGYGVLVCNETPGFGDKMKYPFFKDQFTNITAAELTLVKEGDPADKEDSKIVAISGATISSQGVVNIFNTYIGIIREQLIKRGLIK